MFCLVITIISDEIEFVYDTWFQIFIDDWQQSYVTIFNAIIKKNLDDGDENDPFRDENDENNLEYTTAEDSSDIEADLIIEPN